MSYHELNAGLLAWSFNHGIRIVGIIILILLLKRFGGVFIESTIVRTFARQKFEESEARERRQKTLARVFATTFNIVILLIGGLMILSEFAINIAPIIAGAGIIGVAIGFGGQYLIRDLISGIFIILENQYRVNDVICIGTTCGQVEDISLRVTILRDLDGTVHHIPNGEVRIASNKTKGFSRVVLTIGISYENDMEKVIKVVNEVGKKLANDKIWRDKIISPPEFLRIDDFTDSSVMIKILGETKTLMQWAVAGEYRKRLKVAFDKSGIVMHSKK